MVFYYICLGLNTTTLSHPRVIEYHQRSRHRTSYFSSWAHPYTPVSVKLMMRSGLFIIFLHRILTMTFNPCHRRSPIKPRSPCIAIMQPTCESLGEGDTITCPVRPTRILERRSSTNESRRALPHHDTLRLEPRPRPPSQRQGQ